MRDADWDRCYVSLVSEAMPTTLRNRDGDNQEKRLWDVLIELGGKRLTLDQIVKQCEYRRFQTTVPLRSSVKWHLKSFADPERKIVKIDF